MKEYLNQVSNALNCSSSQKRKILAQIRASLQSIPGVEEMSMEQLLQVADPPQDAAELYLDDIKAKSIFKDMKIKNRVRAAVIAILALIALLVAIYTIDWLDFSHGYFQTSSAVEGEYDPATDPHPKGIEY